MPIPRVAIVGRPNVGKSSLMNMLAGAKVSIVDPTPGVTRDRVSAIVDLEHSEQDGPKKVAEFIDTGGFGVYTAEGARYDEIGADLATLTESIEAQIAQAVETADLVLFCIDVQQGITPIDEEIARQLREGRYAKGGNRAKGEHRRTPPVQIVATKTDGPKWELHALELSALGFGEPLMCSAMNNYLRRAFVDAMYELLPENVEEEQDAKADLLLAIVGKRNAGKSTLVNTLAGEPRMIVSEIAGTTRDAVDVKFEMDGRTMIAIDTAGHRRKKSFQNMVEHFAFDRVQRSIERADVVILLLDGTDPISQVDEQLAALIQKAYKPVIIVVNKWDLIEGRNDPKGRPVTTKTYEKYVRNELRALHFAPIAFMSGEKGENVRATVELAFELKQQAAERVTTGKLNRLIRGILETRGPTDTKGTQAKVYYVAQTGVEPPTITMVVNHPELFRPNYMRFLMNRFREELPFEEVPVRLVVRARRQRGADDLADRGEGEPERIVRGKKGAVPTSRAPEIVEGDEELLSDEFSEVFDLETLSDDAEDYFDEPKG